MKISNKQYAESLVLAVKGKNHQEISGELNNFVKILASKGDLSRSEAIIAEFSKRWLLSESIVEASVVSADKLDKEVIEEIEQYVIKETKTEKIHLTHKVDKSLLAGFILRFNDRVVDGSAVNMIGRLTQELSK